MTVSGWAKNPASMHIGSFAFLLQAFSSEGPGADTGAQQPAGTVVCLRAGSSKGRLTNDKRGSSYID
jgi:hypothetical protein